MFGQLGVRNRFAYTLAGVIVGLSALPAHAESLLDLYQVALKHNPAYKAGAHQRDAASESYYQARSQLLPQVAFTATHIDTEQDIISSDNQVFASGSTSFPTEEHSLTISQSIYSYAKWAELAKSKGERSVGEAEFIAVEQDLLLDTAEAYFAALSVHEDLISIQAEVRAVKEYYDLVQAKRIDGLARKADLLDAQARYLQAHSRELEIRSRLRDALQGLREVTGELPASLKLLAENFPLVPPEPASPEKWVEMALVSNPELMALRKTVDVARDELRVQKGGHYPTLDLKIERKNRDTQGTLFGGGSEVETQEITFELSVPIYAGGNVSSKVREAVSLHSKAQEELDQELRAVQRDTYAAYDSILSDIAKIEVLQKSVEAYEVGAETKRVAYNAGLTSGLTLLDAERDLFFARTEYAHARYGYILSILRLKRTVGVLSEQDLEMVNSMLSDDEYKVVVYGQAPRLQLGQVQ